MTAQKAKALLAADMHDMTLDQLQAHKVKLLDAWRESKAEYGIPQAVKDGFYVQQISDQMNWYRPIDLWLIENLSHALDLAEKLEAQLLSL